MKARRKWNQNVVTLVQICFSSQAFMNEERTKESVVEYFCIIIALNFNTQNLNVFLAMSAEMGFC